MQRLIAVASLALIGLFAEGAAVGALEHYTDKQMELIAVDKRMQRAFVDKDVAAIDDILTDDYVLVLSDGSERTKADVLNELRSANTHWDVNETSGWEVKIHGDVAIVVAMLHQKGVDDGKLFDSDVRFSDTYIREKGFWRNIHAHASRAVPVK